jgi:hypothetical protein
MRCNGHVVSVVQAARESERGSVVPVAVDVSEPSFLQLPERNTQATCTLAEQVRTSQDVTAGT